MKQLLSRLADAAPLRLELLRLGADEHLARDVSQRIAEAVESMTELGDADPRRDAELLERISNDAKRTADALEGLELPAKAAEKSLARRAGEGAVTAAAGHVGKVGASKALPILRDLMDDQWPKLQVGLLLAWHTVRDWFIAR